MQTEWQLGDYTISTDAARLDVDMIYQFLSTRSYWAKGRTRAAVKRSIAHSLSFGLYRHDQQIGFARVVTDYATFAYLADVFVLEAERGRRLGKWLIAIIVAHPDLQGLRRWLLATRDAHGLYQQAGFTPLLQPERWMERFNEPA